MNDKEFKHEQSDVIFDTYDELEKTFRISSQSPEAYYAESAWNHALIKVMDLIVACADTEKTIGGLVVMLKEEIDHINTFE